MILYAIMDGCVSAVKGRGGPVANRLVVHGVRRMEDLNPSNYQVLSVTLRAISVLRVY
jgi:hypothetical protein